MDLSVLESAQPFDLAFFSGSDYVSDLIKFIEYHELTDHSGGLVKPGSFSHVGMIVTTEVLQHPKMEAGKLYIFESTMGGHYGQGVYNIDGFKNIGSDFMGVQIRPFKEVVEKYSSCISLGKLADNPLNREVIDRDALKKKFTHIVETYNGITYDANCCSLLAAIFAGMRPLSYKIEKILGTTDWLFCSELVAQVYKDMGILPIKTKPKYVVPMDFIGYEEDTSCGIPKGTIKLPLIVIKSK